MGVLQVRHLPFTNALIMQKLTGFVKGGTAEKQGCFYGNAVLELAYKTKGERL